MRAGLSPRVRGNREFPFVNGSVPGSIPACAGEPFFSAASLAWTRVYPRVCGGTSHAVSDSPRRQGLSPRVRGNREAAFLYLP